MIFKYLYLKSINFTLKNMKNRVSILAHVEQICHKNSL